MNVPDELSFLGEGTPILSEDVMMAGLCEPRQPLKTQRN